MAGSYHAGTALLDVLPSLNKFHSRLRTEMRDINPAVTVTADMQQFTRQVAQTTRRLPAAEIAVRVNQASLAKAEAAVTAAEQRVKASRDAASDATAQTDIAEKRLAETRAKSSAKASQIAAAELKVAQAHRASAAAANETKNAQAALVAKRKGLDEARSGSLFRNDTSDIAATVSNLTKLGSAAADVGGTMGKLAVTGAGAFGNLAGGAASALGPIGAVVIAGAGLAVIVGGAGAAAASLIGLANAAITASGAVGLIPGGLASGGAVFATFAIGTMGITDAVEAMGKAQGSAAKDAKAHGNAVASAAAQVAAAETAVSRAKEDGARAQTQAAQRVREAEEALQVAREDAARAAIAAERQVVAAERQVADAVKAHLQAQRDLTQAVKDAADAQEELNFQVRGGTLDAAEAALDLADAQRRFQGALDSGIQGEQLERLRIAYERQQLSVEQIADSNAELAEEQAKAKAAGVKGADAVVEAQERLDRATRAVADAEAGVALAREEQAHQEIQSRRAIAAATRQLSDAEDARAQAAVQASRQMADAQTQLAAAYRAANDAATASSANADAAKEALAALSPEAQKFVQAVWGMKPAWDAARIAIQDALFQGLDQKLIDLGEVYLPIVEGGLSGIASAANDAAREIVDMLLEGQNTESVRSILDGTATIVKNLGAAMSPIIEAFLMIADVGVEVLADVSDEAIGAGTAFRDWIKELRDSGKLKDWMAGAVEVITDIIKGVWAFGKAMVDIITSLNEGVEDSGFYDNLGQMLKDFIAFAQSEEGKKFFYNVGKTFGDIGNFVLKVLEFIANIVKFFGKADEGMRKLTGGATGVFETLTRIYLAVSTLGLSELIIGIFTLDWDKVKEAFTTGTTGVLARVALGFMTFGLSEVIYLIFKIDWEKVGEWFQTGGLKIVGRVALGLLSFGLSELIYGLFKIDWEKVGEWFATGGGTIIGRAALAIATFGISELIIGLFKVDWDKVGREWAEGIGRAADFLWRGLTGRLPSAELLQQMPGAWPMGRADGGYIAGPGGPRDDVIPAMLSNGEFVVNAEATKRNRAYLETINAQHFAAGGLVGTGGSLSPVAATAPAALTIDVAAIAALGEVAAAVTEAVALLQMQLATLVADILAHWTAITTATVDAANQITTRQTLLQQFMATSWAVTQAAVWASVNAQGGAFTVLMNGMAAVRAAMGATADWAVGQYGRIRAAAADPIRWVLQQPFNAGLIAAWNKLNADFALGKHVAPVGIPFAVGGQVPGHGNRDSVRAFLTPGEYVLSKPAIANLGGVAAVDRLHQLARAGVIGPDANLGRRPGDAGRRLKLMRKVPLDGLGFLFGGVQPHVAMAGAEIEQKFGRLPGGIGGVGSRPNVSDHPFGLALDFMTMQNLGLGDRIAGYLQANAARLMVKYLIWRQRINEGGGWSPMADRGSITANHFDHVHTSFLKAGQAGRAFGGNAAFLDPSQLVGDAFKPAYAMAAEVGGRWPGNTAGLFGGAIATQALDAVKAKAIARMTELMSSVDPGGASVERWRPLVLQALARVGQPASLVDIVLRRMMQESGGNPSAINNWDSNARAGYPSSGLMQVIRPTFDRFRDVSLVNNLLDPMANVVASMRYALGTYGSLAAAYNKSGGYRLGGIVPGSGGPDSVFGRLTPGERILTPPQTRSFDRLVAAVSTSAPNSYGTGGHGPIAMSGEVTVNGLPAYIRGYIHEAGQATGTAIAHGTRG